MACQNTAGQRMPLSLLLYLTSFAAFAAGTPEEEKVQTEAGAATESTWIDEHHSSARRGIKGLAHQLDDWFGEPDPNDPASANLRIILDTNWNKYDDVSFKPRIRGRLRLPVLEERLSVVFGDDSLDNELQDEAHIGADGRLPGSSDKRFDRRQSREENSSLALRWSDITRRTGLDTDVDLGVRSGNDIYVRFKAGKSWQLEHDYSTRLEQIYRYGIDSKHYVRTNFEVKRAPAGEPFVANHLHVQYTHDNDEEWEWGNSLYRQHDFAPGKWLNYGVYAGGFIENKKADINGYGPFVGYRQPFWRDWLFAQTELNYYNDRRENRSHHVGVLLRLEALF